MTTITLPWDARARELAGRLSDDGVLRDSSWRAALEGTPRHVFVPSFYRRQPGGSWIEIDGEQSGWLQAVYSDETLVTALAEVPGGQSVPASSATRPSLLVRMLEALEVRDGHRVLEIGTGTGFSAAVLCRRLGAERVFSVGIGAGMVETVRRRLAGLGYAPTLTVGHGEQGLAGRDPFDRVIATCSVPAVPWIWAEQMTLDGLVVVDVKPAFNAGNLVLLRRFADRLEGRFLPGWAAFVAMRDTEAGPEPEFTSSRADEGAVVATRLDPALDEARIPWFLARSVLPPVFALGSRVEDGLRWVTFSARDGSWCEVEAGPGWRGERCVRQGGPVRIWDRFERTHTQWTALGRPGWDRFGLTVTPDGFHRVWLDDPDGEFRWTLPPPG